MIEKPGENITTDQKFKRKNLILLYSKYFIFSVVILLLLWFLFALPRILEYKEYYSILRETKYKNLIIFPDTIPKIGTMPDFSDVEWQKLSHEVDSEGVKLKNYDDAGIRGISGLQKYPSTIAGFAENHLSEYLKSGNKKDLLLALRQIDYLTNEFKTKIINGEEVGLWYVNFDLGYQYNVKAPWRSGFSQAYCLESMLYAYQITGDLKYLNIFEKGISAYRYSTTEGGLSYKTKNGGLFFEEVVTSPPLHHILNGHMDALIKIYKCAVFTNSSNAKKVFDLGVIGLKDMLPDFDRHGYSLYSLSPNPSLKNHFNIASPKYHNLHIAQLRSLADITGEKMFLEYSAKWQNETGGVKEFVWIAAYVMFKDLLRTLKSVERTVGFDL